MAKISTTSRTLSYIRKQGWTAQIVEKYNQFSHQRLDLFNIIDIVAMGDGQIIGIQSCGADFKKHDDKILDEPRALEWLQCGARLILIGWRKVKMIKADGKKGKVDRYESRIKEYKVEDFERR